MPQIVREKSPVIAAITERTGVIELNDQYVRARKAADKLATEYGLPVADMPMVIRAMTQYPEFREVIRPGWADTITSECHGQRDGERSYEAWHSVGSLATAKGLKKAFSEAGGDAFRSFVQIQMQTAKGPEKAISEAGEQMPTAKELKKAVSESFEFASSKAREFYKDHGYLFTQIADKEWAAIGKGTYNGQNVARLHLDDVKKGSVPVAGTPYTVFVRLDKDRPEINNRGQLGYDAFMQDDRVLMITGSPENREALAKMLFSSKKEGGEGWSSVGSYHRINDLVFDAETKGRLVSLYPDNIGLGCSLIYSLHHLGCFVTVGAGGAVREKSTLQSIVQQQTNGH